MTEDEKLLVPLKQAARQLGRSPMSVRRMMRDGKLTPVRFTDSDLGSIYFRSSELKAVADAMFESAKRNVKLGRK